MNKIYRFILNIGWTESNKSWPIYDEEDFLVGAFTVGHLSMINCFVSGVDLPICLKISSGDYFYATPFLGNYGQMEKIVVSELKLNEESILVTAEEV